MKTLPAKNATNRNNGMGGKNEMSEKKAMGIDGEVCVYCVNHLKDVCKQCTEEGKFRYLEPEQLEIGEGLPDLGSYRYWVNANPHKIRAMVYLHLYYRQRKEEG